ncbi:MAG: bifunctional folylpolyglutamate synthase/dihydrofolate synthase [Flavobacteriales bacterium]
MEQRDFDRTYSETLDFLFSQLPMFQRVGAAAYKADLNNTLALCSMLGNPEQHLRFVHVAGTNGKGSVSHMTASVLQEAGYKTGLFTSPHLRDFRERIRVNGKLMEREAVVSFVERYRSDWSHLKPSFFEITFAMALWYFEREKVDVVVLETGMGGRLDSTNVVKPEVSVITTIGFDHVQFLGNTLAAIAGEKAGIIKPARPVVIGVLPREALEVVIATAGERKAPLVESARYDDPLPKLDLAGPYQEDNARTALTTIDVLRRRGYTISDEAIAAGMGKVVKNTGFRGRWQILGEKPLTIADCAHNEQGLRMVMRELARYDFHDLHFVIGVSGDKDLSAVLAMLPKTATYYFTAADVPRALPADQLQALAGEHGLTGEYFPNVRKAYEAARLYAKPNDVIYIGGSVFVVAEVV